MNALEKNHIELFETYPDVMTVQQVRLALQAAAERDGTAPTKDTVREAIQKAMPTRE